MLNVDPLEITLPVELLFVSEKLRIYALLVESSGFVLELSVSALTETDTSGLTCTTLLLLSLLLLALAASAFVALLLVVLTFATLLLLALFSSAFAALLLLLLIASVFTAVFEVLVAVTSADTGRLLTSIPNPSENNEIPMTAQFLPHLYNL